MKQITTISCKLKVKPELAKEIEKTLVKYANACQFVHENSDKKLTNNVAMQALMYDTVREKFQLSAQTTIHSIRRVCSNRKTSITNHFKKELTFSPTSVDYDSRTFSLDTKKWIVSLKLLSKRTKIELLIGNYQRGILKGSKSKSAVLTKRKDGSYYINIHINNIAPEPTDTDKVIGIDLGRTDIATTSSGESWSGKDITSKRNHYSRMRAVLQQKATKGTRSSRRRCRQLQKRLSGQERRFQKHINHEITTSLVRKAATKKAAIAIEDLTNIRARTNQQRRTKKERRLSNNWAFYQFRMLLTYKCVLNGVKLILVNPAYTSQTCHKCLHIHPTKGKSYRNGKNYHCNHCGWTGDADYNGAKNIAALGLTVNQPGGSWLSCEVSSSDFVPRQLTIWDMLEGYEKPAS
ncbi:transposase [Okeania sp. SIO2B3]|uniref:RNA-guided endonuclease InsQ/TnpB family protein n=1 Tax=Okeania sp. SIO2B3 TaxID=2607784 RepID=UPI0013BF3369|nr:transposase [Okeania sp. SIO2B3]NET47010.1 IS200/IS605 family element transposase accessory protein TnpB [Okeania sp. SIO2B3]